MVTLSYQSRGPRGWPFQGLVATTGIRGCCVAAKALRSAGEECSRCDATPNRRAEDLILKELDSRQCVLAGNAAYGIESFEEATMSGSEADAGGRMESTPEQHGWSAATCGSQTAMRMGEAISGALQRHCPTSEEVKEATQRLRGSIRAQPIMAVLVAACVGILLGRLTGPRKHTMGAQP